MFLGVMVAVHARAGRAHAVCSLLVVFSLALSGPKGTIRGAYVFRKSLGFWRCTQHIEVVARQRGEEASSFAP